MYVRRAYWLLCISNALIICCRILRRAKRHSRAANATERCLRFENIPSLGMKRSLTGNEMFPSWE